MSKQPIHPYAVYTSQEAADILDVDPVTIQRYVRSGKLMATKLGKVYRISGQSMLDLMTLDTKSVEFAQDRARQVENSNYIKSKSYLLSHPRGQVYMKLYDLTTSLLVAALNPNYDPDDQEQLTVKYIGCRVFNTAMAAYRDALSGYYQVSFSNQRDLIEVQFLLDLFRTFPEKIKDWRESTNEDRYNNFSPAKVRKILDERDGFIERKREQRYKQFCEYASHVSYPGIKLLTNDENLVEIGSFYNENKLMNCIHELCLNYGYTVASLCANIKINDAITARLSLQHMELFDKVFNLNVTNTEKFQKTKENLNKLIQQLVDIQEAKKHSF